MSKTWEVFAQFSKPGAPSVLLQPLNHEHTTDIRICYFKQTSRYCNAVYATTRQ